MKTSELRKIVETAVRSKLTEGVGYTYDDIAKIAERASKKFGTKWRVADHRGDRSISSISASAYGVYIYGKLLCSYFEQDDAQRFLDGYNNSIERDIKNSAPHAKVDIINITLHPPSKPLHEQSNDISNLLKKYPDLKP